MEKEEKEANKPKDLKLIAKSLNWLNLPNPIATNIILEHLEIFDYIRFSAVCKDWQLIQKEHRIRYSPNPPPSPLPFPWLKCTVDKIRYFDDFKEQKSCFNSPNKQNSYFYIPNKQKLYNIPFCITRESVRSTYCKHGWVLLLLGMVDQFNWCLCIYNPITSVQIELPPLMLKEDLFTKFRMIQVSSTPSDPDCTIMIMFHNNQVYFCRLNNSDGWKMIDYSKKVNHRIAFFNNKIYTTSEYCDRISIVDTLLPNPVEQVFEIDSEFYIDRYWETLELDNLLGELVIVIIKHGSAGVNRKIVKQSCKLYRADFLTNKWERMESLGDHALFYSSDSSECSFLLPAIDVGCKKNTIYFTERFEKSGVAWTAFDLSTKERTDGPQLLISGDVLYSDKRRWSWFLPTLDYFNGGKATGD